MGEIGEVLELLHGARCRFRTARGAVRLRSARDGREQVAGFSSDRSDGDDSLWRSLLDPAPWIPAFDFHVDGDAELIGRPALRVGAVARRCDGHVRFPAELNTAGADAYELLVDRERGVVLRVAALADGEELWVAELEELHFDEELRSDPFAVEARVA